MERKNNGTLMKKKQKQTNNNSENESIQQNYILKDEISIDLKRKKKRAKTSGKKCVELKRQIKI